MPLYLLAAGATAVAVIAFCLLLCHRARPGSWWLQVLVATGQLSLTLYVAHVVIGMTVLEVMGRLENQTLAFAVPAAFGFFVLGALFATLWRRRFRRGPLESTMRRVAG
jgi:uncharacterized membrane protein YeiB